MKKKFVVKIGNIKFPFDTKEEAAAFLKNSKKPQTRTLALPQMPPIEVGVSGPSAAGWHSVADFLACHKMGQFRYVRGLRRPVHQMFNPFATGILVHAGRGTWLAHHCRTDKETQAAVRAAVEKEVREAKLPMSLQAERSSLFMIDEYINYWSARAAPRTVAVEYEIGPAPFAPNDPFYLMRTAKLDDVGRYPEANYELCIGELKTTSQSVKSVVEEYTLHGQTMMQQHLWRVAKEGAAKHGPVVGTMLDIIVKGGEKKKPSFAREFIPFTERQLEWFAVSMRGYLKAIVATDWATPVPRNVTACAKSYGEGAREFKVPCEYRDLCKHGRIAAGKYVDKNGRLASQWQPTADEPTPPWE